MIFRCAFAALSLFALASASLAAPVVQEDPDCEGPTCLPDFTTTSGDPNLVITVTLSFVGTVDAQTCENCEPCGVFVEVTNTDPGRTCALYDQQSSGGPPQGPGVQVVPVGTTAGDTVLRLSAECGDEGDVWYIWCRNQATGNVIFEGAIAVRCLPANC